jgi:TonB family protein
MLKLPSVFNGPAAMAGSLALHLGAAAGFARHVADTPHRADIEFAAVTSTSDAPKIPEALPEPAISQKPVARPPTRVAERLGPKRAPTRVATSAAAQSGTPAVVPHFSLPALSAVAEPAHLVGNAPPSQSAGDASRHDNGSALARALPSTGTETFTEAAVDVPARLLASAPVAYPPQARSAGIESSVALEIVVDTRGRVTDARMLAPVGYGLDEAALSAIHAYRFTPAERFGRRVSVRMRWSVRFSLR